MTTTTELPSLLGSTWLAPSSTEDKHAADTGVHPSHQVALPSREDFDTSPHYPLIMTPNPLVPGQTFFGSSNIRQHLPLNGVGGPIPHENPFWKGVLEVHVANTPTTDRSKFEGKKRMHHVAIQGRYKYRHLAATSYTGSEFCKPGQTPPAITELIMTAISKSFSSTVKVNGYGDQPYCMNPVLASWQLINVSRPGEEPGLWEAQEDMRLMSPKFVGKNGAPMSSEQRRKFCDNPANTEELYFEPEYVYTQHVWCHLVDMARCKLILGGLFGLDIAFAMNEQPFPLMIRDFQTGQAGIAVLIWHKDVFYNDDGDDRGKKSSSSSTQSSRLKKLGLGLQNMLGMGKKN